MKLESGDTICRTLDAPGWYLSGELKTGEWFERWFKTKKEALSFISDISKTKIEN